MVMTNSRQQSGKDAALRDGGREGEKRGHAEPYCAKNREAGNKQRVWGFLLGLTEGGRGCAMQSVLTC